MQAHEYIRSHLITVDINPAGLNKNAYLTTLCHELAVNNPAIKDPDTLTAQVLKRESIESTGIGSGIAFPHARTEAVSEISIAIARIPGGIDFNSIDRKPVKIVILMAVPTMDIQPYLRILSHLSKLLRQQKVQDAVLNASDTEELRTILAA